MPEAIQQFISVNLGPQYAESPTWDLSTKFQLSSPMTPLMFILSPGMYLSELLLKIRWGNTHADPVHHHHLCIGANPTEEIFKLSVTVGMQKRIDAISFGQQQGPIAERAIENAIMVHPCLVVTCFRLYSLL